MKGSVTTETAGPVKAWVLSGFFLSRFVRDHVPAGRAFSSVKEVNAAFAAWVPLRRAKVHRTYGEVIGHRAARDHTALRPLPKSPMRLPSGTCVTPEGTAWSPST